MKQLLNGSSERLLSENELACVAAGNLEEFIIFFLTTMFRHLTDKFRVNENDVIIANFRDSDQRKIFRSFASKVYYALSVEKNFELQNAYVQLLIALVTNGLNFYCDAPNPSSPNFFECTLEKR